jgi:hypothetical protein
MKKVIRILALSAAALAVLAMPSSAYATCNGITQPLQHIIGMFFTGCPDATPVQGYAYVVGQEATLNTSTTAGFLNPTCNDGTGTTTQGQVCQPEAGIPGDGNVTVTFDWGGPAQTNGSLCPNAAGVPGVGRNVVEVVANDGSSIIMSVSYSIDFGGYILEMAHPGDGFSPVACSFDNGLTLVSNTAGLQANTVCVGQTAPQIYSDCDLGSGGAAFGNTCQGDPINASTPSIAPGQLYTLTAPCSQIPDLRRAAWSQLVTTPGAGGSKCAQVTIPPATPVGTPPNCAYVGGSSIIAGVETAALTGHLRITGNAAASDKVAIKKAELLQGKLVVGFGTENEATIVGFNVYAGTSKLNSGLIQAKGIGSNDYSFEVGRGALKNERSITVEAVKSDGTTVRSGSVSVK